MKIACDACEAKYSISDDKVRGKVFKIRCKKCSNVIVVRGVGEAVVAPIAASIEDDRIWHLVVHEDQVGPLTVEEVRARFVAGEVDGETFTWREGQADWLPLSQVTELATLTSPMTEPATPTPASLAASVAESNVAKLRGERNESSVLFSLGNLAQIATRAPARAAAATSGGGLEMHTATQEGSGLIDIRSMASAYLGSGGMTAKPAARIGSIDDLPVFDTRSAFSEPSVLVPTPVRAAPAKMMYLMIAAIVAFATVAIVLLVMLLHHDEPVPIVAAPVVAAVAPPPVVTPPPPPPVPPMTPVPPVVAQTDPPKQAPPAKHQKIAALAPVPQPLKQSKLAEPKATPAKDCDEISCVVNADSPCCQALRSKPVTKQPPAVNSNLPEQLTSSMITSSMNAVHDRAMSCGAKSTAKGRVKIHLKVNGEGHVTDATVEATPDDALAACVVATARHATFPATQSGRSFSVPYSF